MNLADAALIDRAAVRPPLPASLNLNRRLGQWLRVCRDGWVEVRSGKVELGQGIATALAQVAAEELDVGLARVQMVAASTEGSPNEAVTSGSLSVQESGSALRHACAEARAIYLAAAAARLGVDVDRLQVEDGEIAGNGARTSYWELADDALLDVEASGRVAPKPAGDYRVVGASVARIDLPDKVFGRRRFIHDLELPGLLHGYVLRPPAAASRLVSLDQAVDGAMVVRDGSLVGVLADTAQLAERAVAALRGAATWERPTDVLPDQRDLSGWLRAGRVDRALVASKAARDGAATVRTLRASFSKPFLAHASLAPSCALARFAGGRLEVWSHSQGIYNLRADLALALRLPEAMVVVRHVEGAGCYGHNGADDVAFDAAWLARAANGRPVRVQWTRADELAWSPFGPAMAIDLEADLDRAGGVVGWRHTVWSNGHSTRPGRAATPALLGGWHLENPFPRQPAINPPPVAGGGAERNAAPSYDFPAWEVVSNRVLDMPLRTSALRSLGAFGNVFAAEGFMDELAAAAGDDPIAYRLRHIADPRAAAVVALAVERSGWRLAALRESQAFGIGYARYKNAGAYCAVVALVEATDQVRVLRLTVAVDVGLAINPDGVANQIEGGAIQATSWTLKEAVRFDRDRVTSDSWEDYPILRFSEVPNVEVHIVPSDQPSLGAGEASMGPTAAAIANAAGRAIGTPLRHLPLTRERLVAELL